MFEKIKGIALFICCSSDKKKYFIRDFYKVKLLKFSKLFLFFRKNDKLSCWFLFSANFLLNFGDLV